jgi:tetratricopeptide (TPR) repeat protein
MKAKYRTLILILASICLNSFSQDYSKIPTDLLKAEILKNLNDKTWEFGYINLRFEGWYQTLKITDTVRIVKNNFILLTKHRTIYGDLNDSITYASTEKYEDIHIGDSLRTFRTFSSKTKPRRKEVYFMLKEYQHRIINEKFENELSEFQKEANIYTAQSNKPSITEEQRKYIVQANALNNEKKYAEAIDFYKRAIEINPVAYPSAYYNMALLYAQTNDFRQAIFNIKKYLLLVPDAPDARAAQDKIYEWELRP